jgi:hypothetical protein
VHSVAFVNLSMEQIRHNCLLARIIGSVKQTLGDKFSVQRYSNAFIVLEFLLGLRGNQGNQYLFSILEA